MIQMIDVTITTVRIQTVSIVDDESLSEPSCLLLPRASRGTEPELSGGDTINGTTKVGETVGDLDLVGP
jgi:hypothetical protein